MNKYVLRTSLVWLIVLLLVIALLLYRSGSPHRSFARYSTQGASRASGEMQPEVSGPTENSPSHTLKTPEHTAPASSTAPTLAPIQLSPQQMQSIGVKTGEVQYKHISSDVRATGNVDIDERLVSYVQVRFPGYIRKVFANATYEYVHMGEPLFTVYSPDLVATQQEFLLARQNQKTLGTSSVDGVASGADALAGAAEQRLRQWEVPQAELDKLKVSGKPITDLTINSPASGYITERNALPNLYVQPSTRLYTIAGLSRVWVYAQVFQNDIGRVKSGDTARVTVDSYPGQVFRGSIDEILPQVDLATRTVRVRLSIANPGLKLKPGMFVNVDLKAAMGRALTIPATAVLQSGERQIAFLYKSHGNLEPKEITIGDRYGDDFVVLKGLSEHQRVVTSANFLIDSESQLQAAAGAFNSPPPAPGTGGPQEGTSKGPQATVDLITNPNPPQRGNNLLRVKVSPAKGTPITGAEVTVRFYMPAMPGMGMSAMNMETRLSEKVSGIYEGSVKLDSGGTWQVTITVQKGSQTLAVKQLRVNVAGGM